MEAVSRYCNMIPTAVVDEDLPPATPQPQVSPPHQSIDEEDQAFLDRILQQGGYCPQPLAPAPSEADPPLQLASPQQQAPLSPLPEQTGRHLIDPSDLLPTLDVTAQETRRTVTLHFETASVHTSHLFELAAVGSVVSLVAAVASKVGVDYPNPSSDQLLRVKSQPLVLSFNDCSYSFVYFLKQHYKLRSEEEIESIFGFPNFIQGDEKKTYRIMIEKWVKSPNQLLLSHELILPRIEEIAHRGVELKGRLIFAGRCPSFMRTSALATADYLTRLDGPILIICHVLVVPFWSLLINSFKRPETTFDLVSHQKDSARTVKKITESTVLEHGIFICSISNFNSFSLPQTKNLTIIIDDVLRSIIQCCPTAIMQFRSVHRCLVIYPEFPKLKKKEKDSILSELVHPDIRISTSYFELIEKLHVIDTDEGMFSEADKFRIEVGVFTSELDPQRIEEMSEISQILDQRDKKAIKQRYEQMFGSQKLALLEKNLRSHFGQAADRFSSKKNAAHDSLRTPSNVDIEFKHDVYCSPPEPAHEHPQPPDQPNINQAEDLKPDQEAAIKVDDATPIKTVPQAEPAKDLSLAVCGREKPLITDLCQPLEPSNNKLNELFMRNMLSIKKIEANPAAKTSPDQRDDLEHLAGFNPFISAPKFSKSSQKKTFQVGDLEEFISNHIFECAKGALQFRLLGLNSETKISSILEILEQRILASNKRKVVIWVHHQHISEKIHIGCLSLLERLELDHGLKFNLHSIFSKHSRLRMRLICKFREDDMPCIAIVPVLTQKEVLLGIKFDLMIFSELIHQTDALFEAAELAKLCGDKTNKELLFFRSNLTFDFGLWIKCKKFLQEEFGSLQIPLTNSETGAPREERIDLKANRGFQLIAARDYPVYQTETDSFFSSAFMDPFFKNRIRRDRRGGSTNKKTRKPKQNPKEDNHLTQKPKRTTKQAMEYRDQIMESNPVQLTTAEKVNAAPKYRYRSKTVQRVARKFEMSLKSNPEAFQISFPNSLDNSLWNVDIFTSKDSQSLLSVEQSDYSGEEHQVALYDKRSVKSVLVSANSLGLNEQAPSDQLMIRL